MFIRAVQIKINSAGSTYGFECKLNSGLNIIKGNNSSGKSTFVNTLLYGLGLEELVGAKGEKTLTSAVRDEFTISGRKHKIDESAVLVEVSNKEGKVVTFRRPLKNEKKSTKLVEVFECSMLREPPAEPPKPKALYLHDSGAAKYEEGYLRYLETFLGMKLPRVQSSTGDLVHLYPQVVAAALFIEQKRGWTDYIANIPFYKILGAPTRVVQYLLGLDNFALEEKKAITEAEITKIQTSWGYAYHDLQSFAQPLGISVRNIPRVLTSDFKRGDASLWMKINGEEKPLSNVTILKRDEWHALEDKKSEGTTSSSAETVQLLNAETAKLETLTGRYERLSAEARLRNSSLIEFRQLLEQAESDIRKNKTTRKLLQLGAEDDLSIAESRCPTCNSPVSDTLMQEIEGIESMDLQANIDYLEAQISMLRRQITGLDFSYQESLTTQRQLEVSIVEQREYVVALRNSIVKSDTTLEADIRKQLMLEREINNYIAAENHLSKFLERASGLLERLLEAERAKKDMPYDLYSASDRTKIRLLEQNFRANAQSFNYASVDVKEVTIHPGTLMPALGDLTLREILLKSAHSESSASDFVRLIWAFLIAIYQTSATRQYGGNHPGILLFDEPGQHSMSQDSQKGLVQTFSGTSALQSIVAASFDESPAVFAAVTHGSKFHLIDLPEKIIQPLGHDGVM